MKGIRQRTDRAMSKYGTIAVHAAEEAGRGADPVSAWQKAVLEVFPTQKASREKSCPRCAFLGLSSMGLLRNIPPGEYTRSQDNKRYAMKAVEILRRDPRLMNQPDELWQLVTPGKEKQSNHQMDVVIALWQSGYVLGDA